MNLSTLPPAMLSYVVERVPVHPRMWHLLAASCKEIHEAASSERQRIAEVICERYQLTHIEEAGRLLVKSIYHEGELFTHCSKHSKSRRQQGSQGNLALRTLQDANRAFPGLGQRSCSLVAGVYRMLERIGAQQQCRR